MLERIGVCMSILANLLKKAETNQAKADIPPGLLQSVRSPSGSDGRLKKYLLFAGIGVAALAVGGLLAWYLANRPAARPALQPAVVQQQPVITATSAPVQPQVSSAVAAPAPAQPVAAVKPVATAQKKQTAAVRKPATGTAVKQAAATPPAPKTAPEKKPAVKDKATIDALLFAARSAEARRDYTTALKQYQAALEADPHNYRIMNNLAGAMLHLGMDDQALTVANRALAIKPDYPSALVNAGIALGKTGHDRSAREQFNRALTLDPANRSALYSLALSQERAGLLDESLASYRRLAELGDAQGLLGQGRVSERKGDPAAAARYYRELLAQNSSSQRLKDAARERLRALEQ
jgi:Tfp pilus assembly protein PilF